MGERDRFIELTDEQWLSIEPLIPKPKRGGRQRTIDIRSVVEAILYLKRTNCGWCGLPACFPNRSTVRHYYDQWQQSGIWEEIEKALLQR